MIAVFTLVMFAMPMQAQETGSLEPLPEVQNMDANQFVARTIVVERNYAEDPSLSFSMQIPDDFVIQDADELKNEFQDNLLFGEIFNAYGSAIRGARPYIKIQSFQPDRMISAKNWFLNRVLNQGYTLRGLETQNDNDVYEAFYVRLDDNGNTEIVRAKGFLIDNRIVTMEVVIPVALWNQMRDMQIMIAKSFELENEPQNDVVSLMRPYGYLESFSMLYPKDWNIRRVNDRSVNRIDASFLTTDINQFLIAEIDLTLVSARSLRDRIDQSLYPLNLSELIKSKQNIIEREGFTAGERLDQYEIETTFDTVINVTEAYPLRKKQSDIYVQDDENPITREFWLSIIQQAGEDQKTYIVTMFAPYRKTNFYNWAIAVEAYEEMIKSIR
jgi:hypothetical protein